MFILSTTFWFQSISKCSMLSIPFRTGGSGGMGRHNTHFQRSVSLWRGKTKATPGNWKYAPSTYTRQFQKSYTFLLVEYVCSYLKYQQKLLVLYRKGFNSRLNEVILESTDKPF